MSVLGMNFNFVQTLDKFFTMLPISLNAKSFIDSSSIICDSDCELNGFFITPETWDIHPDFKYLFHVNTIFITNKTKQNKLLIKNNINEVVSFLMLSVHMKHTKYLNKLPLTMYNYCFNLSTEFMQFLIQFRSKYSQNSYANVPLHEYHLWYYYVYSIICCIKSFENAEVYKINSSSLHKFRKSLKYIAWFSLFFDGHNVKTKDFMKTIYDEYANLKREFGNVCDFCFKYTQNETTLETFDIECLTLMFLRLLEKTSGRIFKADDELYHYENMTSAGVYYSLKNLFFLHNSMLFRAKNSFSSEELSTDNEIFLANSILEKDEDGKVFTKRRKLDKTSFCDSSEELPDLHNLFVHQFCEAVIAYVQCIGTGYETGVICGRNIHYKRSLRLNIEAGLKDATKNILIDL